MVQSNRTDRTSDFDSNPTDLTHQQSIHPHTHTPQSSQLRLILGVYTAMVVVAVACWFYVSLTDPAQPVSQEGRPSSITTDHMQH